ncbi:hypothetical protein E2562_036745, partial [Oryza meyeriana var. granulata]
NKYCQFDRNCEPKGNWPEAVNAYMHPRDLLLQAMEMQMQQAAGTGTVVAQLAILHAAVTACKEIVRLQRVSVMSSPG